MQQYQSVLESQLKKGEHANIGWPWRLFLLSVVVCVLTVLLYGGMRFGYESYLQSQIDGVSETTRTLEQEIKQAIAGDLVNFYSQLANLQSILTSLTFSSRYFTLLEGVTHQSLYFDSLDINEREIVATGMVASPTALTQQFEKLRTTHEFANFVVDSVAFNTASKLYEFKMTITLPTASTTVQ